MTSIPTSTMSTTTITTVPYGYGTSNVSSPYISNVSYGGHTYTVRDQAARSEIEELKAAIEALKNKPEFIKVEECPSCGGELEMKAEDAILKCKYCKRVVFVGTMRINSL